MTGSAIGKAGKEEWLERVAGKEGREARRGEGVVGLGRKAGIEG